MTDAPIFLEREDEIAWLVLNRPRKMNAMTDAMWRMLSALAREADEDAGIKVIILKGVDGGAFRAGADIADIEDGPLDDEAVSESLVGEAYGGEDHREGVDAFLAGRRPGFTYR